MRFPDVGIDCAKQMPYEDKENLASYSSLDEQKRYWMRCLETKQKNIERTKKYAGDQNVEWWDAFFGHQHTILDNYMARY